MARKNINARNLQLMSQIEPAKGILPGPPLQPALLSPILSLTITIAPPSTDFYLNQCV